MNSTDLNTDKLAADLKRVVRDSEELLHATVNVTGEKASELRERLSRTLETAKQTCRGLEEKAIESAKAADKIVREHPYQSLSMAFGVGLLVGVLTARK